MENSTKVILIIGAGDATGFSIAKKFAQEGYFPCLVRRDQQKLDSSIQQLMELGYRAQGFALDATNEDAMRTLVERIESTLGAIEIFVFNVGMHVASSILTETAEQFYSSWKISAYSAFISGQAVAQQMVKRGRGTIIFTGATASLRGGANFASFASSKNALRALAQSMARELWPLGIHVAHSVIDGLIDTATSKQKFPEYFEQQMHIGGIINPEQIADAYWYLHGQSKDLWTHELDMRPYSERW